MVSILLYKNENNKDENNTVCERNDSRKKNDFCEMNDSCEKNEKEGSPETKRASLLLLRAGLREMNVPNPETYTLQSLSRTEGGKPFIASLPGVHFNLSHSGSCVACAFSGREVGLDLQLQSDMQGRRMRIADRFYTSPECEALRACPTDPDQAELFFRLWTIKEAYLKYIGCGLRVDLDSFLPDPLRSFSSASSVPILPDRGQIHILKAQGLLRPAQYALLPAPAGYTMAVCAASLPPEIPVREIR